MYVCIIYIYYENVGIQHTCMCVCLYACMLVCMIVFMCVCMFVCMHAFVCTCMCLYAHACMYVCMYTYTVCICVFMSEFPTFDYFPKYWKDEWMNSKNQCSQFMSTTYLSRIEKCSYVSMVWLMDTIMQRWTLVLQQNEYCYYYYYYYYY